MSELESPAGPDAAPLAPVRRRWLPWAVAGTALVLILGLAAWWLFWSARLVWPAEDPGAFGITVPSTSDTAQWTFGESVVCL